MFDYIFFDPQSIAQFKDFLQARQARFEHRKDELGELIAVEEYDDPLGEEIDAFYDQLMDAWEQHLANAENSTETSITAISFTLEDQQTVYVPIAEELMNRLLSVLSANELSQFIDNIVRAVEHPDTRPVCQHQPASPPTQSG